MNYLIVIKKLYKALNVGKENIGILLLGFLVTVYSYYSGNKITKDNLKFTKATLSENVHFGENGGDMPYKYAEISIMESTKSYTLINCSYDNADLDKLKILSPGDSILIGIYYHELESNICILKSKKYGEILGLDNYNSCNSTYWKRFLLITFLFLTYLLFIVIKNYRKQR